MDLSNQTPSNNVEDRRGERLRALMERSGHQAPAYNGNVKPTQTQPQTPNWDNTPTV